MRKPTKTKDSYQIDPKHDKWPDLTTTDEDRLLERESVDREFMATGNYDEQYSPI